MGNRPLRERIRALDERIREHRAKIAKEQTLPQPDMGLIRHWQREIRAFTVHLQRLEDRMAKRRRRGR